MLDLLTRRGGGGYKLASLGDELGLKPSNVAAFIDELDKAGIIEAQVLNDSEVVLQFPGHREREAEKAREQLVSGFAPGTIADCARAMIAKIVAMEPSPHGYAALLPLESFAAESGFTTQQVADAATLLEERDFVKPHHNSNSVQLTRQGREEAHRLGEPVPSPKGDAQKLLALLAAHEDGASELESDLVCNQLGFHYRQLLDAGAELEADGTGEMTVLQGRRARLTLTAHGRATFRP